MHSIFARRLVWFIAFLFALPGILLAHGSDPHAPIVISITDTGFVPAELTVTVGETVTFENDSQDDVWPASDNHPTHEEHSAFDPQRPLLQNAAWSFTFNEAGEYGMHDHLAPEHVGMIYVVPDTEVSSDVWSELQAAAVAVIDMIRGWFTAPAATTVDSSQVVDVSFMTDFTAPTPYDQSFVRAYELPCSSTDFSCIDNELNQVTVTYGPHAASEILERLLTAGTIATSINDHQLSHQIGRNTARAFGVNAKSFQLCPTDMFNGGCQHGFFEYVLGRTDSTTAAADAICASLDDTYSAKFKFYCYHGVGHGVMMQQAYDLDASLAVCDSLGTRSAQEGCWQGVFMENVNAVMTQYAQREGVFSDTDPLAPCNAVASQYRQQCYLNHAGYLMQYFTNDVAAAAASCLQAEQWTGDCMQSIGLMVTNPVWQAALHGAEGEQDETATAIALCSQFPSTYQRDCVLGGVDNITNFDRLDVTRADAFCAGSQSAFQTDCYTRIGSNLAVSNVNTDDVVAACNQLQNNNRIELCLSAI